MLRFVDALDQFSDQFVRAAAQIPDAGSLLGNSLQRDLLSKFYANPKLANVRGAILALDRAWSAIVSNAYQSKAQLPQGAMKSTAEAINANMPFKEMLAMAQRIRLEGTTERYTFDKQLWDLKHKQEQNPIGQATGFKAGPPPTVPREMTGKPADGDTRLIRMKGSSQTITVYYDAEQDKWTSVKPQRKQQ